jgi:hypothetical protein
MDSTGSGMRKLEGFCEHGDETSGSMEDVGSPDQTNNDQLLKNIPFHEVTSLVQLIIYEEHLFGYLVYLFGFVSAQRTLQDCFLF